MLPDGDVVINPRNWGAAHLCHQIGDVIDTVRIGGSKAIKHRAIGRAPRLTENA